MDIFSGFAVIPGFCLFPPDRPNIADVCYFANIDWDCSRLPIEVCMFLFGMSLFGFPDEPAELTVTYPRFNYFELFCRRPDEKASYECDYDIFPSCGLVVLFSGL